MDGDDDIAAALPRPPHPAPARREAAIAEAMRRFDGIAPSRAAEERDRPAAPPWWSPQQRPYAASLAAACLVALIGLPWVWTSFDRSVVDDSRERRPGVEARAHEPVLADADSSGSVPGEDSGSDARPQAAADEAPGPPLAEPSGTGPASAPILKPGDAPVGGMVGPVADSAKQETGDVVVTGSRIRNPNLETASPVTAVGGEDNITVTGTRMARAAPRRRGDWNACTIDDPGQNLAACGKRPAAKGASGQSATHLADGLSRAWAGDLDSAMASFDRAIELEPRSSAAYLNRALAWRRRGDLDRALADLDRAVRYSPRGARYYFHRSLVLRQRGDTLRARADEERAVALDPRYGVAVRPER